MFKLQDLWQALLSSFIRFWDNRFQQREDPMLNMLRLELDKAFSLNKLLLEALTVPQNTAKVQEEDEPMPIPVGRKDWRVEARKLEADSRRRRRELETEALTAMGQTYNLTANNIAELEKELGVTE